MELNQLFGLEGLSIGSIIANLISGALITAYLFLSNLVGRYKQLSGLRFFIKKNFYIRLIIEFMMSALLIMTISFAFKIEYSDKIIFLLIFFIFFRLRDSLNFRRSGIIHSESSIEAGTDYSSALRLCQDGFSFLGTGANKLANAPEFKDTMIRCSHSNSSIRFLLSSPNNPIIAAAEKRAGKRDGSYRGKVLETLNILKKLKDEHGCNFEVRLYEGSTEKDFENFRMMFIDGRFLLLSYNRYGDGDGRNIRQLVIERKINSSIKDNFYFPFDQYYEGLWKSSTLWDLKKYIDEK